MQSTAWHKQLCVFTENNSDFFVSMKQD